MQLTTLTVHKINEYASYEFSECKNFALEFEMQKLFFPNLEQNDKLLTN